jgi:hypothetical protein
MASAQVVASPQAGGQPKGFSFANWGELAVPIAVLMIVVVQARRRHIERQAEQHPLE